MNIGYRSTWSVIIGIGIGPEKHISVDPYFQISNQTMYVFGFNGIVFHTTLDIFMLFRLNGINLHFRKVSRTKQTPFTRIQLNRCIMHARPVDGDVTL